MSALLFAVAVGLAAAPGDRILIESDLDSAAASQLEPGTTVDWLVHVSTTPGEPGIVDISLAENGDLRLEVAAFRCATEWDGSACAAGETSVRSQAPLPAGGAELLSIPDTDDAYLRLVVVAPEDVPSSATGSLTLRASGASVEGPHSPLQPTGSMPWWTLACAAIGALAAGTAITASRALRRRR